MKYILTLVVLLLMPAFAQAQARIAVGEFSAGKLDGWEKERFEGETDYVFVEMDGESVLRASSRDSASGLVRQLRIDLWQTPYLNWRWQIANRLPLRNESTKAGDDYPVRLYVVVKGGLRFWKTKALNYTWSRGIVKGSAWPNAYTEDNIVMLSLRDSSDSTQTWYEEKRNVLQDLQQYVGPDVRYIDAIAIMSDSDDTDSYVTAYYGDIFFSRQ